jgi:PRA1 family protein 3
MHINHLCIAIVCQVPDFKDLDKWARRMQSNLLYYQTNYFAVFSVIFLLLCYIDPLRVVMGSVLIITTLLSAARLSTGASAPAVGVTVVLGALCVYYYSSLAYALLSLLVPVQGILFINSARRNIQNVFVSVIFVHASLRLRNMKNKLTNSVVSLEKTPMSLVIQRFGLQVE